VFAQWAPSRWDWLLLYSRESPNLLIFMCVPVFWLVLVVSSVVCFSWCFDVSGFAQLGEVLSFASPRESTQRKGDHSSLAFGFPRSGVTCRVNLIRHPCLKQALLEHPVLITRKITPPLGSSEGGCLVPLLVGCYNVERCGIINQRPNPLAFRVCRKCMPTRMSVLEHRD